MNDRTAYRKTLTDCLTQDSMPPSDETILENKELTQDLLEEILLSDMCMYIDKTDVLTNILSVVYETDPNDKVAGIEQFFKQADAHACAGVFLNDSALTEALKNKYMFELIGKNTLCENAEGKSARYRIIQQAHRKSNRRNERRFYCLIRT